MLEFTSNVILRHNIIELIETEKEYVKDLALIVEVKQKKRKSVIFTIEFHRVI